ncbi:Plant self-incompatibility S1 [Corchorus olitorius]|uniref:S-protein homolog n=1 Tax=Corchorus olitorius TaxID=93759 RepID=A0A1R3KQ42_9ROSI|nr:Plant self-incompatibility S1 [Corchorus olitorius]
MANMSYSALAPFVCILLLAICSISQTLPEPDSDAAEDGRLVRLRFKVHITNGFPNNVHPFIATCRSHDDYLGTHTLWKNGEFRFKFMVHFWKTTHFTCNVTWGPKSLENISVFKNGVETRSCKRTGNCFWKGQEDGIYFCNNNQSYFKKYSW